MTGKFTVTFTQDSSGAVLFSYSGNLPVPVIVANLEALKFELMMQQYKGRQNPLVPKDRFPVLQPKRIENNDGVDRYRVA